MTWLLLLAAADFDVLIRNARVVDGTGNPWYRADVGIRAGRIAKIGALPKATATNTVDAAGRVLAPGFIDVHTHIEAGIFRVARADAYLMDGVTTLVTGNCGASNTELGAWFNRLRKTGIGPNVAALIGHNSVRQAVMGDANRAPTADELRRMRELVARNISEGAIGFATGLWYVPGTYSQTAEVVELAKAAKGVYATHMRDEGESVEPAIREAIRVGKEAGLNVQVSHFKIIDKRHWGGSTRTLAMIEQARREGLDIVVDQYPYTAASASIDIFFPREVLADGPSAVRERLSSPESKRRVVEEMRRNATLRQGQDDYTFAVIASFPEDRTLEGKRIPELSADKSLDGQIEALIQLRLKGRPSVVYHTMSDADVDRILAHPFTAIASDGGLVPPGESMPHPRNYGTNARILDHYVRQRNVLTLEDAIRKMTSLPARTFRMKRRGEIREGFAADLVLFDPAKVASKAEFTKPHQFSEGFDYVMVNGTFVVANGHPNSERPGQIVTPGEF
ncbi:MAG: D-aminoacylase [Acidobacteria bacterium]|nr:D-aminoacylase [Acidobacteriota bacterium]